MITVSRRSSTITAMTLALAVVHIAATSGVPSLAVGHIVATSGVPPVAVGHIAAPSVPAPLSTDPATALPERVEIHRTEYGVPHILSDDLEAMGFGLGYVQSEDYGASIAVAMVTSRGNLARHLGADELDGDFVGRDVHARAVETFHRLEPRTQDVYRGFAEGVNHYVRLHADEFPPWVRPDFTGIDALARDVQTWSRSDAARFVARLARGEAEGDIDRAGPAIVNRDAAPSPRKGNHQPSLSTAPMHGPFMAPAPSPATPSCSATPTFAGTATTTSSPAHRA